MTNNPAGYRTYPYSRSAVTNPLNYSNLQTLTEVHGQPPHSSLLRIHELICLTVDIGEVWANMLHNVLAALVDALGFSSTAKTDASGPEGNVVFMHLMLDALPLQPCNPTCMLLPISLCSTLISTSASLDGPRCDHPGGRESLRGGQ